jgi:formylglycine-generating enzyme required for sulfatase activity/tRNA A-37 threonylcarbamoyl transferase component Bud32
MLYCLNPACSHPQNPDGYQFCQGCGQDLAKTAKAYDFHGRYRASKFLGEGAFGRAYQAEDLNFHGKPRVIKKLMTQLQGTAFKQAQELFEREAVILDELIHPQLARVYDYFQDGNSLYLVREFIEGETLWSEVKRKGRFSEKKIQYILEELLSILDYLHSNQVLNLNIKPENIIHRQTDGKLVLIDFWGIKFVTGTTQNQQETHVDPPDAVLEQMLEPSNPSSDIYGLGVTCVRLLTGCLPPNNDLKKEPIYDEKRSRWLWKEYLKKQEIQVSQHLERVLDKMLQHSAGDRYQSAQEVLDDLRVTQPTTIQLLNQFLEANKTQTTSRQTIISRPSQPPSSVVSGVNNLLTRKQFLKLAGWGGVGIMATFVAALLSRQFRANFLSSFEPPVPSGKKLLSYRFDVITVNSKGEALNRETKQAKYFTVYLGNDTSLDLVAIPGGKFLMGSPSTEKGHNDNESPQREVTVSPFYLARYPITQAQWEAVMGKNPAAFKGADRPVEGVSWDDCLQFCEQLSQISGLNFRLPSEAEWEYACRAGTNTPFHFGETITSDLANYNGNYTYAEETQGKFRQETTPVGSFPPNAFGLYDMHGNVWEWCGDTWQKNYEGAPTDGRAWINKNNNEKQLRVLRGGSWYMDPENCRCAIRFKIGAGYRGNRFGVRVLASAKTQ